MSDSRKYEEVRRKGATDASGDTAADEPPEPQLASEAATGKGTRRRRIKRLSMPGGGVFMVALRLMRGY